MPRVTTYKAFAMAFGLRPVVVVPSTQWRVGPFDLDATIANGAATDVDLTTQDPWYGDHGVRQAYSLSDGNTSKMEAIVHIEAIELLIITGAIFSLDVDTKDNLHGANCPFLEAGVQGTTTKASFRGAIRDLFGEIQRTQAAAADGEFARYEGRPKVLGQCIRVKMKSDQLKLKTDGDAALGSAPAVIVRLHGGIVPESTGLDGAIPGGVCGVDDAEDNSISVNQVRDMQLGILNAPRFVSAF